MGKDDLLKLVIFLNGFAFSKDMAKILVVDDEPLILKITSEILRDKGHSVTAVAALDEALRCAKSLTYDLIITDKNLGSHRGITPLLDYLQDEKPDTKVLLISAEDGTQAKRELYCNDFYSKLDGFNGFIDLVDRLVA